MIETVSDAGKFFSENQSGDWIVHAIPVEDGVHPAGNSLSIIFFRNISTGKTYYYSSQHPDSKPQVNIRMFLKYAWNRLPPNKRWAFDAKAFHQLVPLPGVLDANLCGFLDKNDVSEWSEYETAAHNLVRRHAHGHSQVNRMIPLVKHMEAFDDMCDDFSRVVKKFNVNDAFLQFNDLNHTLGKIERNGIFVDAALFEKHFNAKPNDKGLVFSQYNVYTSTGRPSNRYGGINYAALNKDDGSRSCFVSRYGNDGRMVVVDYTAFHPRIICRLTDYPLATDVDIYEYLARLYYQKKVVDETDIANAKQLTFRQLYGGVEDKYAHIKYLANLKTYIDTQWEFFKKNGYVETPVFKRRITEHHIQDPSPTKVFNYILQAVEGEIAIPQIRQVMEYLASKKTKAVLYTYDAVLYDFHKDDGLQTLNHIRAIMSNQGMFPMKTYIGSSYQDVKQIAL